MVFETLYFLCKLHQNHQKCNVKYQVKMHIKYYILDPTIIYAQVDAAIMQKSLRFFFVSKDAIHCIHTLLFTSLNCLLQGLIFYKLFLMLYRTVLRVLLFMNRQTDIILL